MYVSVFATDKAEKEVPLSLAPGLNLYQKCDFYSIYYCKYGFFLFIMHFVAVVTYTPKWFIVRKTRYASSNFFRSAYYLVKLFYP